MADFLTTVKSVHHQRVNQNELDLTVATSPENRVQQANKESEDSEKNSSKEPEDSTKSSWDHISSPEDVLHTFRSQPDLDTLVAALKALHSSAFGPQFSIHVPGPLQSQIVNCLVASIIPDFWPSLKRSYARELMLCLSNVAGFNAIFARLRLLNSETGTPSVRDHRRIQESDDLIEVIELLFKGNHVTTTLFQNLHAAVVAKGKRVMVWREFINLMGSGKVISIVAQALDRVYASKEGKRAIKVNLWLTNASEYSTWLGSNVAAMLLPSAEQDYSQALHAAALLLAKSLSLGYSNSLFQGLFRQLAPDLMNGKIPNSYVSELFKDIPPSAARLFLESLLRWLTSMTSFDAKNSTDPEESRMTSRALASLISLITGTERRFFEILMSLLSDPTFSGTLSLPVRRACLATILSSPTADDGLQSLLDKYMATFNDTIFANHAPIAQQESLAQMLLITAGYIHRRSPMTLLMTARSSNHMQGVSNRLDSSNVKARWLGMVVATAISSLVDKEGARMNFGTEDMQIENAQWYLQLVNVEDNVGILKEFLAIFQSQNRATRPKKRKEQEFKPEEMLELNGKPIFGPPRPPAQTEVIGERVKEVLDSDEEPDEDDLKPYAKPDSDPEDSDEDATLVNRHKVKPPVYIRDLMSMLRDDKNHNRFQLGIKHAASLIRRKSNFGAEVKDHVDELGIILCNLHDPFKTEDFNELKLQAMIAVLLSDVRTMAPWLSKHAFLGDYSITQRCAMLSALGLGGRELAGLKNEDDLNPALSNTDFPSKRLPSHLDSIYKVDLSTTKRLQAASKDVEQALIKPMALQAADHSTAHLNAVKIRTFSSRMEVERTKRKPAPNALAKIFGEAFFFPLANRYQQEIAAYSSSSVYASVPFLLVTFLKTLALLLHASGPATAGLTEISSELWDLLLSLRVTAIGDISILQAVLFSLLTLLEVNTDKQRIVQQYPRQLMETQQWVEMVFERMGGGVSTSDNADEAKVQTLAAGVLVKTREVIETYQKELVGFSKW